MKISLMNLFHVVSMLTMVVLKSMCSISKAIIVAIILNGSFPFVIVALSYLHKYYTLAKITTIDLSNSLGLLATR